MTAARQRATAIYLIDKYALRAGNEKGEDEADTVGCCSLRCEHISLDKSGKVTFDFLGKDSIRYYKEIDDIHPQVFKNLRMFKGGDKKDVDTLFDRVTVCSLRQTVQAASTDLGIDLFVERSSARLHEGLDSQGVPYLQCLNAFRANVVVLQFLGKCARTGEGECIQCRE